MDVLNESELGNFCVSGRRYQMYKTTVAAALMDYGDMHNNK
jgi:hypothetical protein